MSGINVSKINITNNLNNIYTSICKITSFKSELMSYFYLSKNTLSGSQLTSESKDLYVVNINSYENSVAVDLSFVCVEDKEYENSELFRFKILPDKDKSGLFIFPYLPNENRVNTIFNNGKNGYEYKIWSIGASLDTTPEVLNNLYNVLFSNILYNQNDISEDNDINKNVFKKRNNSNDGTLIYFKPLIKLEGNETIDISFNVDNTNTISEGVNGNEIIELQEGNLPKLHWSSVDYSQNKFLNVKDLDIGSRKLKASILFKNGGVNNDFYKFNESYYDISLNINGVKITYNNSLKYLINLNLDDKPPIDILAFNNTGTELNNLTMKFNLSDRSISIDNIKIKVGGE